MTNVIVTTAIALSAKQKEALATALSKKIGSDYTLEEVVRPDIIGGIKVRIGSKEFDRSVKSKLDQLHQQLLTHL